MTEDSQSLTNRVQLRRWFIVCVLSVIHRGLAFHLAVFLMLFWWLPPGTADRWAAENRQKSRESFQSRRRTQWSMITTCNASIRDNAASSCDSLLSGLRLMCGLLCCSRRPSKLGINMTEGAKGGKWRLSNCRWLKICHGKPWCVQSLMFLNRHNTVIRCNCYIQFVVHTMLSTIKSNNKTNKKILWHKNKSLFSTVG